MMAKRRWSMMVGGLVIAGAAAGAVAAITKRRRDRPWEGGSQMGSAVHRMSETVREKVERR